MFSPRTMASVSSDPTVWMATHRVVHPAEMAIPASVPTPLSASGGGITATDAHVHACIAQPHGTTFTCFLCSRHGTSDAPLYSVICNCPPESRRSLHRTCASRIEEKHRDGDIRCRVCLVGFELAPGKPSSLLFWQDVLRGTTAGFVQPFVVLVFIAVFVALSDMRQNYEDAHSFLEYIHFWVVPAVAFAVWTAQRIVMEYILPWRPWWLRFAKPWSCLAIRIILPVAAGTQYYSRTAVGSTHGFTPFSANWSRFIMAICCDIAITIGTMWVNYHFAPISSVSYSPFVVLFISFILAVVYAKAFRRLATSIRLGEQRPETRKM